MTSFLIAYFIVLGIMFSVLACFDFFLAFFVYEEPGFLYLANGIFILVMHFAIGLAFLICYSLQKSGVIL